FARARRTLSFSGATLLVYPGSTNHGLVFCPYGAEPVAVAGKTGGARPERAPIGSFRRGSLSDETPPGADAKASSSGVCEPLRTYGDECMRILRGGAEDRKSTRLNSSHD